MIIDYAYGWTPAVEARIDARIKAKKEAENKRRNHMAKLREAAHEPQKKLNELRARAKERAKIKHIKNMEANAKLRALVELAEMQALENKFRAK